MNFVMEGILTQKKAQKKLTEAVSNYSIEDFKRLLDIDKSIDFSLGIIAQPLSDDIPIAWDNTLDLAEGSVVHITGNVAPGGPADGQVEIRVPFDRFSKLYELRCDYGELEDAEIPEEDKDFVRSLCASY